MSTWALVSRPQPPAGTTPTLYLALGAALGISACLLTTSLLAPNNNNNNPSKHQPPTIPSPLKTHLPHLSPAEIAALPYPPTSSRAGATSPPPTARSATPCVALAALAEALVRRRGCRVMLFDLFGRGYSDAPCGVRYDARLYVTQVLLVLASSRLGWTAGDGGFHLVGYSLGGGLAVAFARYFAGMLRSLVLVAGCGLVREAHVGWRSRLLYSTGVFPEGVLQWFIRRRLMPRREDGGKVTETKMAAEVVKVKEGEAGMHKNSDASGGQSFDNAVLLARRPDHTVSTVMEWQLRYHQGFIPAFVSSIRYAPIYDQKEDWHALGQLLAARRERPGWEDTGDELPGLRGGRILLVLGASDPVIVKEELIHDATAVLSEDGFEAVVLEAGHELVMTKSDEVAAVLANFWSRLQDEEEWAGRG
ncbi:Alpha/Beta hydrolase protein [Chaetomium sp. MPI-CAGE-AT-0009]|nr:Alpha/Beta hydrolase protein [Chaetomium sp. MPI-CAGE-AT-0009]